MFRLKQFAFICLSESLKVSVQKAKATFIFNRVYERNHRISPIEVLKEHINSPIGNDLDINNSYEVLALSL